MSPKKWLAGLLLLGLCDQLSSQAQTESAPGPSAEDQAITRVLKKSLFFPGFGQLAEKQYLKAALFAGGELFCLAAAFVSNHHGDDSYWQYRFADNEADAVAYRAATEKYDRRRNIYLLAGAGIWIVNLADILIHAKKKYKKKGALSLLPVLDHEKKTLALGLMLCF